MLREGMRNIDRPPQSGLQDTAIIVINLAVVAVVACISYVVFAQFKWRVEQQQTQTTASLEQLKAGKAHDVKVLAGALRARHEEVMNHELRLRKIERVLNKALAGPKRKVTDAQKADDNRGASTDPAQGRDDPKKRGTVGAGAPAPVPGAEEGHAAADGDGR